MKKRDARVELLRIFACWIVVGTHIKLMNYFNLDGTVNKSTVLLSNFFGEGVAIFFIILGFFYFKNSDFKKMCVRTIKSIIFPAVAFVIIVNIFSGWVNDEKTIVECIGALNIDLKSIMCGLLSWDSTKFFAGQHLWFCFTYIQCILWFPVLKAVYENNRKVLLYVIALGILSLATIDIQKTVKIIDGTIANFSIVPVAILLLLIGNELYKKQDLFIKHKGFFILGCMTYLLFHIILYFLQYDALSRKTGQGFAWNCFYSLITATGVSIAFLSIEIRNTTISAFINYIGNKTFLIYLLHYPIVTKMYRNGVRDLFYVKCQSISLGAVGDVMYTISFSLFIFVISLVMAICIDFILLACRQLLKKWRDNRRGKSSI